MSTEQQDMILEFARKVLSSQDYNEFVRLLQLREHKNPYVRAEANAQLLKITQKLRASREGKPNLHAV